MADWLCRGLQILVDRFDSVPGLLVFLRKIKIKMKAAIIGAGVVGRLLAFKLKIKNSDLEVSLFDKSDDLSSCSYMSAGMLSPFSELNFAEKIIADLGIESIELWKENIKLIEKSSNKKIFFQQNGTLVIAHRQDFNELKIFKRNIDKKINNDDKNIQQYKLLNQSEIKVLEPDLEDKFSQGIFFEKDGQIDPRSFLSSTLEALKSLGIKIFFNCEVEIFQNRINEEKFDLIFDCRGLGATKDLSFRFDKGLRGVRGEIIVLQVSENNTINLNSSIRLIHPRFPLYISPRENGKFVVGATMIESEDMSPVTVRSNLEILTAVFSINSQFGEARILESNVQLRPTFKDNLPKIIYDDYGYFSVNGLYRHGFLISPKMVELTMNLAFSNQIEKKYSEIFLKKI